MQKDVQAQFMLLLRQALHPSPDMERLPLSQEQWLDLFRLAREQRALALLFPPLEAYADMDSASFSMLKRLVISGTAEQIGQNERFRAIYSELRRAGLSPLVIKGPICAACYPNPDARSTSDVDLYVQKAEFAQCCQILEALGMQTDNTAEAPAEIAYSDRLLRLEVHRKLFSGASPMERAMEANFSDAFARAVPSDGFLTLCPDDHLLYLLLHACKHFILSGVGVRQACDIVLFGRRYTTHLDWQQLLTRCAEHQITDFAGAIFAFGERNLGITLPWPGSRPDPAAMLADMLDGGIYGSASMTRRHTSTVTLRAFRSGQKKKAVLPSLFPKRTYLQRRYPYLVKYPILLPVAWISRLFTYLFHIDRRDNPTETLRLAGARMALLKEYKLIE